MGKVAKHIILGAGGAVGKSLAAVLLEHRQPVKLVSRSGGGLQGAESVRADLADERQVLDAVEPGSVAYLLAGLPYSTTVWRELWPRIMRNVVRACAARDARLVFFDNVYMYGKVDGPMTEETPFNPRSRKGEIRAAVAELLLTEMKAGNVRAAIARSADFYGPEARASSIPFVLVFDALRKGKKARWLSSAQTKHSYTYTPDCGRALHAIAGCDEAFGQVWHMPTASPPITGRDFIRLAAESLGVTPRWSVMSSTTVRLGGLFDPTVRELGEMLYQYESDYLFDSSKFEAFFKLSPTPYEAGIRETARSGGADAGH